MKIFIVVVVLSTNNVGEYFEVLRGVRLRWIAKVLVGKANSPKRKVETIFTELQK